MGRIEMNLAIANRQAEQLEQMSATLRRLSQQNLNSSIQDIKRNWESESANRFCFKGTCLSNSILASANQLKRIADNIRTVARNTYNAEKRAEKIARARTYRN